METLGYFVWICGKGFKEMNAYKLADKLESFWLTKNDDLLIKTITMLRQQADRIAKYEQVLQSITNDYHELSDHKIEVQNRNHKKWAREALEK